MDKNKTEREVLSEYFARIGRIGGSKRKPCDSEELAYKRRIQREATQRWRDKKKETEKQWQKQ